MNIKESKIIEGEVTRSETTKVEKIPSEARIRWANLLVCAGVAAVLTTGLVILDRLAQQLPR